MRNLVCVGLALTLTGCMASAQPPARRIISTPDAPPALAAYSQGIQVGNTLYLAGQIGLDPKTRTLVPGGFEPELRRTLDNCKAVLTVAGFTLADVTQVQVLLADINDYAVLNQVYVTYFPKDPPARAAYAVADLPVGAKVEILMTAVKTP